MKWRALNCNDNTTWKAGLKSTICPAWVGVGGQGAAGHGLGVTHMPQRFIGTAANNGLMWNKQPISSFLFFQLHAAYTQHIRADAHLPHKCIALVLEHAYLLYCAVGREGLLQDVLVEEARQGAIDAATVDGAICGTALVVHLVKGQRFEIDCKQRSEILYAYQID